MLFSLGGPKPGKRPSRRRTLKTKPDLVRFLPGLTWDGLEADLDHLSTNVLAIAMVLSSFQTLLVRRLARVAAAYWLECVDGGEFLGPAGATVCLPRQQTTTSKKNRCTP